MNTVQPIRDATIITAVASYLGEQSERNRLMFIMGIYTGLRVSDILKFRVMDVRSQGKIKEKVYIRETKTGKERAFPLNRDVKKELESYTKNKADYELLFPSRKGSGKKPITRQQAYNIMNEAGAKFGLENIGTHTMRKTFGYWHYKQFGDVAALQKIFNHATPQITLRYIGIETEELDSTIMKMHFIL